MTEPDDPSRLLDDPAASDGLKSVLGAARSDIGSDAQVARLAERLAPLLGAGAVAGASAAGTKAAATLGGSAKLGLLAVALVVAGSGVYLLAPRDRAAPPVSSGFATAPPVLAIEPSAPVVEPPPPAIDSSAVPSLSSAPSVKQVVPAQPSEADLLEQARAALKGDPSRALQRTSEHARRFPRGVLVQEREVLAIQALRALGRGAEAERRAEAFAKAFPGSAFQRKLKPSP